jgi:glyoxylase-like metal-dependent hydrolase (beta-lactamase superfamily II)
MNAKNPVVIPIDLNFRNVPGAIASYLIPYSHGAVLVETGPSTTLPALIQGLQANGYRPSDVTDIFLTHIHLDHAGASGWLAGQGARIHVHPLGAPHLQNPEKLLASAARIYGNQMETLWGEVLPVPAEKLSVIEDGDVVEVDGIAIKAINTPGHANHHYAYLLGDFCFSGDIGGIRVNQQRHLRLPLPPPELNLQLWRESIKRLYRTDIGKISPTHYGIFTDPDWHLAAIQRELNLVEQWLDSEMSMEVPNEQFRQDYRSWITSLALAQGFNKAEISAQEAVNPTQMSADGLYRYWTKYRAQI